MHPHRILLRYIALAALSLASIAAALSWSGATWRGENWFYDRIVGAWQYPPSDRVVIVAVDEQSLAALGQWPWSRSVHAALVRKLGRMGVRGIAFDILLSEPGRDADSGDTAFVEAVQANGRVVLPVAPEPVREGGPLIESMQSLPAYMGRTAVYGHTDVELDPDEIARRLYLRAGLGDAHWPALGLALLQLDPRDDQTALPGLRADRVNGERRREADSPYLWHRDHQVLLRYAGPPGTFEQVSYVDVLNGAVPPGLLRGRWVVVGVTAGNLGRMFLTPISGNARMSGPEYQANVVEMLLQGKAITPLSPAAQAALSGAWVLLLTVLALGLGQRRPWITTALAIAGLCLFSWGLLHAANLWFGPMAAIATALLGHLAWTLTHLRHWRRQASLDGLTRIGNRHNFDLTLANEIAGARRAGTPLSLLLIDVDFFKHYNDSMGHRKGDLVLAEVGAMVARHARRPRDLAARIGGDEFALVLPDTPRSGARRVAESLVADIRALNVPHPHAPAGTRVSLSIGAFSCTPTTATSQKDVFDGADAALYRAKQQGRDGFVVEAAGMAADDRAA